METNKPDFRNGFPIRDLRDGSLTSGRVDGDELMLRPFTEQPRSEDRLLQLPEPLTDFYAEDRHELVQKLAYRHWEKRGSPLGSPEIDWFAAEKAVRAYFLASGIELGPDEDLYS
ncbi:MAG: DUF2934 domain-containing protein [Candidatus Sulfotelmatobacter sp.]